MSDKSIKVVRWAHRGKGANQLIAGESKSELRDYPAKISFAGIIWSSHLPENKTDEDFINKTVNELIDKNMATE